MKILKEDVDYGSLQVHIYKDITTGTMYVYQNGQLVPVQSPNGPKGPGKKKQGNQNNPDNPNNPSNPDNPDGDGKDGDGQGGHGRGSGKGGGLLGDLPSKWDEEDEEREKEIEREYEEAKKRGLNIHKETPEEREARIKRINDIFNDENLADEYRKEAILKVTRPTKEDSELMRRGIDARPISEFKSSLERFIKTQYGSVKKELTYHRLNKRYAHTNIVKPGNRRQEGKIPLLVMYLDRSASWTPEDTAIAEQVVDGLSPFVQKKQLKIHIKEFAIGVRDYGEAKSIDYGTSLDGVLDDIEETNPDNVIIMTDGDVNSTKTKVTVPGGAWLIFRQTSHYKNDPETEWVNRAVIDAVHGDKLTEVFKIPYGEALSMDEVE